MPRSCKYARNNEQHLTHIQHKTRTPLASMANLMPFQLNDFAQFSSKNARLALEYNFSIQSTIVVSVDVVLSSTLKTKFHLKSGYFAKFPTLLKHSAGAFMHSFLYSKRLRPMLRIATIVLSSSWGFKSERELASKKEERLRGDSFGIFSPNSVLKSRAKWQHFVRVSSS